MIQPSRKPIGWEKRYRELIELAKTMPALPEQYRDKAHEVGGCEATVWLYLDCQDKQRITVRFDSVSRIVKGLLALIQAELDGHSATDIAQFDIDELFANYGLTQQLTPSRANCLYNVSKVLKQRVAQCA